MPDRRILVLDTSVLLNLLGSGHPRRLLAALDADCVVTSQVIGEVTTEPCPSDGGTLGDLEKEGFVRPYMLAGGVLASFIELVGAPSPDGLGDGEAATIAAAEALGADAALDDKKAIRIASTRRPPLAVCSSVRLFQMAQSVGVTGVELTELLFNALTRARMRVPSEHGRWVIETMGVDRARQCKSLCSVLRALGL